MTVSHQHIQRYSGAIALVVAVWLLIGSLCPQGWIVCLHADGAVALVDGAHATGEVQQCCLDNGDDCTDLAVSLTIDLQNHAHPVLTVRPSMQVVDLLWDVRHMSVLECTPLFAHAGEPPPHPFVQHIRLLV